MNKKISSIIGIFTIAVIGSLMSLYLVREASKVEDLTSTIEFNYQKPVIHTEDKDADGLINTLVCSRDVGSGSAISNGDYLRASSTNLDNSKLSITGSKKEGFNLAIDAINYSGNIGGVEGHACLTQVKDTYLFSSANESDGACKMSLSFKGDTVLIQNTDPCSDYAGANVYFDGQYVKDGKLIEFGVDNILNLKTDKQKQAFVSMVGKNLKLFDGWIGDTVDTSSTGQEIWQNGSRGYGYSSIVIVQGDNIWAVAKDYDEKGNTGLVRYFTNVESDKKGIPRFLLEAMTESNEFPTGDSYLILQSMKGEPRIVF